MTDTFFPPPLGSPLGQDAGGGRHFELSGRCFEYAVSDYNGTRVNERAVEVAVGLALLGQAMRDGKQVLEVGAVLPHYPGGEPSDSHTVIDLHEVYPGVVNADMLDWEPEQPFDLIVCISTLDHLQHMGQFTVALRRLSLWAKPDGLLYVTLPWGQPEWVGGGAWLDTILRSTAAGFWFTKGVGRVPWPAAVWRLDKVDPSRHLWAQVEDLTTPSLAYNGRSPCAGTVYMLFWGDVQGWWGR